MTLERLVFGVGGIHRIATRKGRQNIISRAINAGFRSFDVAPAYGNGLNEEELGAALRSRGADIRITTKFGVPFDDYGARHPHLFPILRLARKLSGEPSEYQRRDYSATALVASVEKSLRRLRSERIDRMLIHEPISPLDGATLAVLTETAERLRADGKIREFGIAGPAASIGDAASHAGIGAIQTLMSDAMGALAHCAKPMIAFGVFRRFIADERRGSFRDFVHNALRARANMELILSSTSPAVVDSFAAFADG